MESLPQNRFLVVENDPNDALLLKRALQRSARCSFSFVCRSPGEAQAYLIGTGMYADRSAFPLPDLIITDLRMGAETGIKLVEWIRKQPGPLKDTPTIILTGSARPLEFQEAERAGAQRVLRKPTKFEDLQKLVQDFTSEFCT